MFRPGSWAAAVVALVVGTCLLAAAPAAPPPPEVNLLRNPGFEEGQDRPVGWTFASGNTAFGRVRSQTAGRSWSRCAQLDSFSTHYSQMLVQEVKAPEPGRCWASVWMRSDGGYLRLRVSGRGKDASRPLNKSKELRCYRGHPLVPHFVPLKHTAGVSDHRWRRLGFALEVPPGIQTVRFEVGFYFTPGRVWLDDAFLGPLTESEPEEPLPEPPDSRFPGVVGDWTEEWEARRIARIGLPEAKGRRRRLPFSWAPLSGDPWAPEPGATGALLTVTDGKRGGEPMALEEVKRAGEGGEWQRVQRSAELRCELREHVIRRETHTSWHVTVANGSAEERWLEVSLAAPKAFTSESRFWDGVEESPVEPLLRGRDGPVFAFPLACVYDQDLGLAVGIEPYTDLSHFAFSTRKTDTELDLRCACRLVLEPGQEREVRFVAFRFLPRWAWREAVQVYYDLFPEFTRPHPDVDPRVLGTDGYVYASLDTRRLQMEECRRFHIDWEWVYGPFQTPGDWYPDPSHWDPRKRYTGPSDLHHNEVRGTIDDYFRVTRDRFHRGRHACAMLFYVVPQFCETSLLESEYADSWWQRADGSRWHNRKGYVKLDDRTGWAWPLNTSYGKATAADFAAIARDFRPSGFAFDVAHGFQHYYGPAQKGLPGRAWSESGTYVLESVALGRLMDLAHELTADGRSLGVAVNGPYTYMMGRRADVVMFEPPPFRWQHYFSRQWPVRLLSGRKPMTWHKSHAEVARVLRSERLPAEDVRRGIKGALDFMLLHSLWLGALPSAVDIRGFPHVSGAMPMLKELVRTGWEPVPAVSAHPSLLCSRYGTREQGFLVLSNPTSEGIMGLGTVDTCYLGSIAGLLSRYDGTPLQCDSDKKQIRFAYDIAPHGALVCRTLLSVRGADSVSGTVGFDPRPDRSGEFVADFSASARGPVTVTVGLPRDTRPVGATWNGAACVLSPASSGRGAWQVKGEAGAANRLVVRYEPDVVLADPREDLYRFPLLARDRAGCAIAVGQDAAADRVTAQCLAAYVEYFLRRKSKPGARCWGLTGGEAGALAPPILSVGAELPGRTPLVLVGSRETFGVERRADVSSEAGVVRLLNWRGRPAIGVFGPDEDSREKAMLRLLDVLDAVYPFFGVLPDRPLYQRAAVAGNAFPDE